MGESKRAPIIMGVSARHLTLVMLTIQNSALILIMHYSRIMPLVNGQRYLASTAVFLNEVFKLAISLSMALYDLSSSYGSGTATGLFSELFRQVFTGDSWKLAMPAMMYTLQNTLQYVAVSNLDAATYQVTSQLKILSTALFSVLLLRRTLSPLKWTSLVLLTLGVAVVQIPSGSGPPTLQDLIDERAEWSLPRSLEEMRDLGNVAAAQLLGKRSATYEGIDEDMALLNPQGKASIGLAAVVVASILSGLAGVYFEKILKDAGAHVSIWVRNVQLSFYSIFPALFLGVMFMDGAEVSKHGFFGGYNWAVWTAVLVQAVNGVTVSLSILYASNIAKNFATSISILLSCLVSVSFFSFDVTFSFVAGTALVLIATYLYSLPPTTKVKQSATPMISEKSSFESLQPIYAYPEKKYDGRLDTPTTYARSSSRPTTPTGERRQLRSKLSFTERRDE